MAFFLGIAQTRLHPPDAASSKNTHLHHAELDAGAGLTRDGLGNGRTAVDVRRHKFQEEGLRGKQRADPRSTMRAK